MASLFKGKVLFSLFNLVNIYFLKFYRYRKAAEQFKKNHEGKKYHDSKNFKDQKPKWINFLRFLDKNCLFPAVVFILSRKKCDMMAESLKNSVKFLLNNKESQANEYFFNDAIKKLKPEDRVLPQVNINSFKQDILFKLTYYCNMKNMFIFRSF